MKIFATALMLAALSGLVSPGFSDELPPGVVVTGQVYIHDPYAPTEDQYRWTDLAWSNQSGFDPGDFLYAAPICPGTAEFGIREEGMLSAGAYEGMRLVFLSWSIQEISFDVYASTFPQWGYDFLRLELWGLRATEAPVLAWSSVGPWSSQPQNVDISVPDWAGYEFRIAVVPEPSGTVTLSASVAAMISLAASRRLRCLGQCDPF